MALDINKVIQYPLKNEQFFDEKQCCKLKI